MSTVRHGLATMRRGLAELLGVRWVRWTAIVAGLALLLRLGFGLLLSFAINLLAAPRDLEVRWSDLSLSLLRGRGEVSQLEVVPLRAEEGEAPEPLVHLEYAVFDLQLLALLTGDLRVRRAEVDGIDARIEREADGTWNLERHVDVAEVLGLLEGSDEEPEADEEPGPIDLVPPLAVEALRFQHARLHVVDRAVEPPLDVFLEASARLSDLRHPTRPARFSATVTAGSAGGAALLDGATLDGTARWGEADVTVELVARMGGLRPRELERYLAVLDVHPASETLRAAFGATVHVRVLEGVRGGRALAADLSLTNAELLADGERVLGLEELAVRVAELSAGRVHVPEVRARGLRAAAELARPDALHVAGLELAASGGGASGGGAAGQGAPRAAGWAAGLGRALSLGDPGAAPAAIARFLHPTAEAFPWSVDALSLEDASLSFTDRTTTPAAALGVEVERAELLDLVHADDAPPVRLGATATLPGVAERVTVQGEIDATAPERRLELDVAFEGLGLEGADPYLARAGLERTARDARLELALTGEASTDEAGRTEGWLELAEVSLDEDAGTSPLFGAKSVSLRGLVIEPEQHLLRLGELEIAGPRISFSRDPASRFAAFGLRSVGRAALAPGTDEAAPASAPAPGDSSAAAPGPAQVDPAEAAPAARVEIGRLAWTDSDVSFRDEAVEPPVTLRLGELGLEVRDLVLGGRAGDAEPEPARLSARLVAEGIVDELALEGSVRSLPGALDLRADLSLTGRGLSGARLAPYLEPLGIGTTLRDGRLALDVDARLVEGDGFRVDLDLSEGLLADGDDVLLALESLRLAGARLGAGPITVESLAVVGPEAHLVRGADGSLAAAGLRLLPPDPEAPPAPPAEAPRAPAELALPELELAALELLGARLVLRDETADPPLEVELDVRASGADLGTTGRPGTLDLVLAVPGAVDELALRTRLRAEGAHVELEAELEGTGVRAGPAERLLPPGWRSTGPGRLAGRVRSSLDLEGGVLSAELAAEDLSWTGEDGTSWAGLSSARLVLPAFDLATGAVRVGPVAVEGLTAEVLRSAGELRAMGLALGSAEPAAPAAAPAPPAEGAPAGEVLLPPIELAGDVTIELERLVVRDLDAPDARPLVASARFALPGPVTLVDEDPRDLPPFSWELGGSVEGLVGAWSVTGTAQPLAEEPHFTLRATAEGLRTAGVAELVPALADLLAGSVEAGRAEATAEATLRVRRARPAELGLARGFGAELRLEGLRYTGDDGEVLAGVDEVLVDVEKIDPRKGLVHVGEVHVERPQASVRRDAEGVHALGLVVRAPVAAPGGESVAPDEEAPAPAPAETAEAAPTTPPAGEVRVDLLTVGGLDVRIEDTSVEPPLDLPLNRLDLEVARFTTRGLHEAKPFSFSAYLGSEPADPDATPVFAEASVAGRLALHPAPTGYVQALLEGLELVPFAGYARASGVSVVDGALDLSARMRFLGPRGATLGADLDFTDLDLSESEGGALQTALSLPVPLETALFLVATPDGGHHFSIGVSLDPDGISLGSIALAATGALAEVVTSAVVGAPFRVVGALVPGGGGAAARERIELAYAPGATELAPRERRRLFALARRLDADPALRATVRHELGAADVERAALRANPTDAQCLELARGLRARRAVLWHRLEERGSEARALYAIGAAEAREASAELADLEAELAGVETSLDRVLDTLREGSERHRDKRTRRVVREMGEVRLSRAEDALRTALGTHDEEQVSVRPPKRDVAVPGGGRLVLELRRD